MFLREDTNRVLFEAYTLNQDDSDWKPEDDSFANLVLGTQDFFAELIENYIIKEDIDENVLYFQEFLAKKSLSPEDITKYIESIDIPSSRKQKYLIYMLKEYSSLSLKEIGGIFNKAAKTISRSALLTKKQIQNDQYLKELLSISSS